ncbi:bifunctional ADP-dependent NAD(P)H-hydrate dehydratase/NAD(P)H-hydrate epimerase [soil metagenome]
MKILSAAQIREADSYTINNEPIASIDLMERASLGFVNCFVQQIGNTNPVNVFCGTGNNGGDGLAIARMLMKENYSVKTFVISNNGNGSEDFQINFERLSIVSSVNDIKNPADIPEIQEGEIVIDAIFGSGLTRPLEGLYKEVINKINDSRAGKVVAVDIASGLFADKHHDKGAIIKADYTISFQVPKLAFLLPENEEYVGDFSIVDIGLDNNFIENLESPYTLLTYNSAKGLLKSRKKYGHKGEYGKALVVAGSKGKMGAAILCCRAALRTGVGLITAHIPKNCWPVIQSVVHEAMASIDDHEDYFSEAKGIEVFDVLGVGPGLGTEEATIKGFEDLLSNYSKPMVLDADALNILAKKPKLKDKIPKNSILTPHPKEFERFAGSYKDDFERLELQKETSTKLGVYILLKGAHSSVSTPEGQIFFNSTGNSGMATGGSGDVLTGMLTALVAQKYPPLEATLLGVYLHGLAGDLAAQKYGKEAMLPSDLIENISQAYLHLQA